MDVADDYDPPVTNLAWRQLGMDHWWQRVSCAVPPTLALLVAACVDLVRGRQTLVPKRTGGTKTKRR